MRASFRPEHPAQVTRTLQVPNCSYRGIFVCLFFSGVENYLNLDSGATQQFVAVSCGQKKVTILPGLWHGWD